MQRGDIVEIKNLRELKSEPPHIVEGMFEYTGRTFTVRTVGSFIDKETETRNEYVELEGNKFYWSPNWLKVKNISFKYADMMRVNQI